MTQAIEDTIKALKEFELELDRVKVGVADAKKKLVKDAGEWADGAKNGAILEAQKAAELKLAAARAEGQREVEVIRKASDASLAALRETIARHKGEAVELVVKRLLGAEP